MVLEEPTEKNLQEPEHKEKSLERGSYRLKSDNFTPGNAGRAKGVFWLMAIPPCKRKARRAERKELRTLTRVRAARSLGK